MFRKNQIAKFFLAAVLLLVFSSGIIMAANLHGYWALDETSGTIAYDTGDLQLYDAACQGGLSFTNDSVGGHFGTAIDFDGIDDGIQIPALNLNSNTVTITAWVKRASSQGYWPGIVNARTTNTIAGMQIDGETNNNLRYCWNDGGAETWGWNSGLVVPENTWTFCALVIEPSKATMYMDSGRNEFGNQQCYA